LCDQRFFGECSWLREVMAEFANGPSRIATCLKEIAKGNMGKMRFGRVRESVF
jgi:hypothetical protein